MWKMAMFKWCIVLVLLLDTVQRTFADPKKCVNTPFDLVIASEDTGEVNPEAVTDINRVYSAIATQLDIGGQHRMAYYTMTTSTVLKNFGLPDHTTTAAITAAFTAVGDQSDVDGLALIIGGLILIFSELSTNGRTDVPRYGLVLDASNIFDDAFTFLGSDLAAFGITIFAIGIGPPFSLIDRTISAIVNHPPVERYRRALTVRDFNFFRNNVLENPTIRLLCPGDIGGLCGRGTVCDKADNTRCVQGTCVCNARLQNTNGVCVTEQGFNCYTKLYQDGVTHEGQTMLQLWKGSPVIGEECNIGECSVADSECSPLRVCQCIEGFTAICTASCQENDSSGPVDARDRAVGVLVAVLPFLLTGVIPF